MILLTRGSDLALAQAGMVQQVLETGGHSTQIRTVSTHGDRDRKTHLADFGGFGAFVKALEEEILKGRGDAAVHSLKDVPSCLPASLEIVAFLPRGPVDDVLVTREGLSLEELPAGAQLGTSSLRRKAQVLRMRPDIRIVPLRGNVETRLQRVQEGTVDAAVLAEAGLSRLRLQVPGAVRLPFVTAPGQGIIGIETCRESEAFPILRSIDHFPTRMEALAERAFLAEVGCGCHLPLAVRSSYVNGQLSIEAQIYSDDGSDLEKARLVRSAAGDEEAVKLGVELWASLADSSLAQGLIERARRNLGVPPAGSRKEGNTR